ncbi:hypothetical protein SAMN05660484_01125 [Eubacterium ruminantium]|uniref:Uncharacterized protein n=1 Tax=Eubacterium ruminantium TaxID=42322 RepID=A0A1T4LDN7_9FIRM|nr:MULTISPECIES: hypothetical protein [Eubacterium]MCR5368302.1 hypothetical protein [Eubacterium sp.]SCW45215.1 hypothetical protein SAMN05660484_01125 [Eubacterium ruminantium]SDM74401.1 hypothetical protein SAMN04490370_1063 [Eubacterium ruminantium]SJZ52770.1 hypothetical protein SAMN02745110_00805 [Eubacterium ruminantium]
MRLTATIKFISTILCGIILGFVLESVKCGKLYFNSDIILAFTVTFIFLVLEIVREKRNVMRRKKAIESMC